MKTQIQQPKQASRTLQSNTKAANQAPMSQILQTYSERNIQRQTDIDKDELLQGKVDVVQREEDLLQGKFGHNSIQMMKRQKRQDIYIPNTPHIYPHIHITKDFIVYSTNRNNHSELIRGAKIFQQRINSYLEVEGNQEIRTYLTGLQELENQREVKQFKLNEKESIKHGEEPFIKITNNTGLPDNLKAGIENLSGYSMDDVQVHYNSPKPAQLQAHAYTQDADIHVAPGQEKHLPHEAWHVVQQKQGRVQPTMQLQGVNINDNEGLEHEADVMGNKIFQFIGRERTITVLPSPNKIVQRTIKDELINNNNARLAIVGETHDQFDETEERATWNDYQINIFYEGDMVSVGSDSAPSDLYPDTKEYRILFAFLKLHDLVTDDNIRDRYGEGFCVQNRETTMKEGIGFLWSILYLTKILEFDLRVLWSMYINEPIMGKAIGSAAFRAEEFKWYIQKIILNSEHPAGIKSQEVYFIISVFLSKFTCLTQDVFSLLNNNALQNTSDDYRILRSRKMLEGAELMARSYRRIIYKIGSSHISDIVNSQHSPQILIRNKNQYNDEYIMLRARRRSGVL